MRISMGRFFSREDTVGARYLLNSFTSHLGVPSKKRRIFCVKEIWVAYFYAIWVVPRSNHFVPSLLKPDKKKYGFKRQISTLILWKYSWIHKVFTAFCTLWEWKFSLLKLNLTLSGISFFIWFQLLGVKCFLFCILISKGSF